MAFEQTIINFAKQFYFSLQNLHVENYQKERKLLNRKIFLFCYIFRKPKLDPDLNVGDSENLLDSSVAKHKLAVKPHKKHSSSHRSSTSPHKTYEPKPGER